MIGWTSARSAAKGSADGSNAVIHANQFCGQARSADLVPVRMAGHFARMRRCTFCQQPEAPGGWADRGACRGVDTAVFFAVVSGGHAYRRARLICASCPVLSDCRAYALRAQPEFGLWGGLAPWERTSEEAV